jgi:hypothetical protein
VKKTLSGFFLHEQFIVNPSLLMLLKIVAPVDANSRN